VEKTIKKTVKKTSKKTKPPAHTDSNLAKLEYRAFNFSKDIKAIKRIWREIGWVTEDVPEQAMDIIFAVDDTVVGCINGNPECSVLAQSGTMRLDQTDLPLSVIAAVTTSRIGRGLGFAQNLTAWQLARGAKKGAAVAALGMFDQGFYNKVGFGTGAYTNEFAIDPS
jgi:predicted acetyltransferase